MHTVLISSSRFGSNYFARACQLALADTKFLGEIFRKGSDSRKYISRLLSIDEAKVASLAVSDPVALWEQAKTSVENERLIAKLYYYHQPESSGLWRALADGQGRVIHVMRRNLFDAFVSREIAVRLGAWNFAGEISDLKPIESFSIMEREAEFFIQNKLSEINRIRSLFFHHSNYHEIFYEDISIAPELPIALIEEIFGKNALRRKLKIPDSFRDSRVKRDSNASVILNYSGVAHLDRYHID